MKRERPDRKAETSALVGMGGSVDGDSIGRRTVVGHRLARWERVLVALLFGTALSGWVVTTLQVSASADRPLTRGQQRAWDRSRLETGTCIMQADAMHRPLCEAHHWVSGPTRVRDIVLLGFFTALVILILVVGLVMPMVAVAVFAATKDRTAAGRRAALLWFVGVVAMALVAWIGVAPESSLAILAGQTACLLTIGISLIPHFGAAGTERLRSGVRVGPLETTGV